MGKKFRSRLEIWTNAGRLGTLADAFNVRVREVVNGEYYIQFLYPRQPGDEERYAALVEDNDVAFPSDVERGQRFRIMRVEEIRDGKRVYKAVEAHHVAFLLNNYYLDDYIDFAAAKTPEELLAMLAADTPYTFVVEGNFQAQDVFEWGEDKKFNLLRQLCQLFSAELTFDNYTITFTTRKGGNYGARVRYRHNMKGIRRTSHSMERVTRLYGYGKNGLTIEGYQGRTVKYIDSPFFDPANPFMAKMEWPDIDDQGKLLEEMLKYLAEHEKPKVSYQVEFVEMEKVDPDFESERIREAGDTVTCYDDELGYHFDARVWTLERYPFEPKRGSATLANFRELTGADYIFQATVGSKKAITYTSRNAVLKGVKYDDSITIVDGLGMKVSDDQNRVMVRLGQTGPGEYGLAMFNKAGAKTIWQDAATGDARFAGRLEAASGTFAGELQAATGTFRGALQAATGTFAGALQAATGTFAGSLQAASGTFTGTVSAGIIQGGVVIGASIQGGTITGALIQTDAPGNYPRVEISNTGRSIRVQGGPNQMLDIYTSGVLPTLSFFDLPAHSAFITLLPNNFVINSTGAISINSGSSAPVLLNGVDVLSLLSNLNTNKANKGVTGGFAFIDPSGNTSYAYFLDGVYMGIF